tara:strand:+ start:363 stop:674 length:312 start_codon:yes stop_codon:yes gene_type:complete
MNYTLNEHKCITSPGKFEGEMYFVPAIWDELLNGGGCDDITVDDILYSFIIFTDQDKKDYPEISQDYGMVLFESDQGFVNTKYYSDSKEYFGDQGRLVADIFI